jgi:hypothetical protein
MMQFMVIVLVMMSSGGYHMLLAHVFSHTTVRAKYARSRAAFNRVAASVVSILGFALLIATLREARRQMFASAS